MYSFSCVLWAIFWSFPLLFKTHPKSAHDKFKTVSDLQAGNKPFPEGPASFMQFFQTFQNGNENARSDNPIRFVLNYAVVFLQHLPFLPARHCTEIISNS